MYSSRQETTMRKTALALFALTAALSLGAQEAGKKTLYVYDEVNKNSTPYIAYFKSAFAEKGVAYDEATAAQAASKDLSAYDTIVIHSMVMAFASKSPVRDWLKGAKLEGKKVALFVTANRWKLDKLYDQLTKLLKKDNAVVIDAVSMATKDMNEAAKIAAVKTQVGKLK
jgi:hypothetical protein